MIGEEVYNGDTQQQGILDRVRAHEMKLSEDKSVFLEVNSPRILGEYIGPTTLSTIRKGLTAITGILNFRGGVTSFRLFDNRNNSPLSVGSYPETVGAGSYNPTVGANVFYVPRTISRGGNFPVELMLAPNQAFSAVCGAFNAVVIKEDGT